ncbi:MAG: urea ABC transporter substrate-binding protein [Cyanobacteria bacterium J06650_10]
MTRFGRRKFLGYGAAATGSSLFLKACAPDLTALDQPVDEAFETLSEDTQVVSDTQPGEVAEKIAAPPNSETDTNEANANPLKVGLLHSLSGPLAISEAPLVEAERLAIEDINAAGGLLGRQIVPVVEDGASDWPTFAEKAEKLLTQHQVDVIFGGFTTASRKAILPVITAKRRLLWYPGTYEGQACSQYIFYGGVIANQQVEPAVKWMLANRGKSFFLVSANDRATHVIAKSVLKEKGGKVAGEAFVPLEKGRNLDLAPVVSDIKQALPEGGIILSGLVGAQNRAFFKALKSAGLSKYDYLVMSLRVSEEEVAQIGKSFVQGHYATWPYFQTIETPDNEKWVERFKDKYGFDRVVGGPAETAYSMVHLWAQAVRQAQSLDTSPVRAAAYGQTFQAPSGQMTMNPNHHVTRQIYIGQVRDDGLFDILWRSSGAIAPTPWNKRLSGSATLGCDWRDPEKGEQYEIETATTTDAIDD